MRSFVFALIVALSVGQSSAEVAQANPIRKVVKMLQSMEKKVVAEGEKDCSEPGVGERIGIVDEKIADNIGKTLWNTTSTNV